MTPRPKARRATPEASPFPEYGLAELGLAPGDTVRFRRRDSERWSTATVARREKDGSLGLHDAKGAARSIAVDLIEVRTAGRRGGVVWEPLAERAARTEQLHLVDAPAAARTGRGGPSTRPEPHAPPAPTAEEADDGDDGDGQLRLL